MFFFNFLFPGFWTSHSTSLSKLFPNFSLNFSLHFKFNFSDYFHPFASNYSSDLLFSKKWWRKRHRRIRQRRNRQRRNLKSTISSLKWQLKLLEGEEEGQMLFLKKFLLIRTYFLFDFELLKCLWFLLKLGLVFHAVTVSKI